MLSSPAGRPTTICFAGVSLIDGRIVIMTSTSLHGRDDDRARIARATSKVVLIAGDSGMGKSDVLASLDDVWNDTALIAAPIVLESVQGSLQTAVARALGDCLHRYTSENPEPAKELWRSLKELAGRAQAATRQQVGELLIGTMFELLETKMGTSATKAIRGVLREVLRPVAGTFDDRLKSFTVPDVASEIAALAAQIAGSSQRSIVLCR